MTAYAWRVAIIVAADQKPAAEEAARTINSGGPGYSGDAFGVALSATGQGPPTHYGLCTSATDDMVAAMSDALPVIDGAMFWRIDPHERLVSSNVTPAEGQPWGWPESHNSVGLLPIYKPFG